MATAAIPLPFTDFGGGLNTRDQPYLLNANQARDLDNLQGTTAGALVKRNGLVTLSAPADTLTSLFAAEATPADCLVGAGGTSLYSIMSNGTHAAIKTGLTSGLRWEFVSAPVVSGQGPVYGCNGTDTPQQWSGATNTTLAANWTNASGGVAVPNGKYCIYANNQVIISGVAATPSRVFWSALADPTNWDPASLTGAGFADFDPDDGQAITAIAPLGPYIVVFKPRKMWLIADTAAPTIRRVSDSIGCVAHRSVQTGAEGVYFLSEDRGVYVTNGTKLTPISDIIQPTIDKVGNQRSQACGVYYGAHYYLSVAGSGIGANDTVLDWDEHLNSWWKHTFGSNQFVVFHPSQSAELFSAKATSAVVDQCFVPGVWQDNGANFTWAYRGPWQSPVFYRHKWYQTPYYRKRLRQVRADGYGTVDFSLATDFAGLETLWQSNVFASTAGGTFGASDGTVYGGSDGSLFGAPSLQRARFYSMGVANAFSVVFSATSNTADAITSYILMVQSRKDDVVVA